MIVYCYSAARAVLFGLSVIFLVSETAPTALARGTVTNCTEAALRFALRGGGTVFLACDGAIALETPVVITQDTVLDGTGHTAEFSGGASTNFSRLFFVQPGASLTLRNVSLTNGRLVGANGTGGADGEGAQGAAIYIDQGIVTLEGCTVSGHAVTGGEGGDSGRPGGRGGHGGEASGAAIYNYGGQLTVSNSVFSGNVALGGSGGHGAPGLLAGNGSNGGRGGDGGTGRAGAIFNTADGLVSIFNSTFSSNSVTGSAAGVGGAGTGVLGFPGSSGRSGSAVGAAVYNASGTIRLVNSTFLANSGAGSAGTAGEPGTDLHLPGSGRSGGRALGGGVFNDRGSVTSTNCTFVENFLAGGAGGPGGSGRPVGFGSDGGEGGDGGDALGGGIYTSSQGTTLVVNCTFSENTLLGGSPGAGGPGAGVGRAGSRGHPGGQAGTALASPGGTVKLRNSILSSDSFSANATGAITDEGFNLSSDDSPALSAVGSRNNIDPLLGPLTATDGAAQTLTLSSNSPAINAITLPGGNGSPPFDQRNAFRAAPYDIGAFEFDGGFTPPTLQAQTLGSQIVLSWPASGNFLLQTASGLSATNHWVTITNAPASANGIVSTTVSKTNQTGFFRLLTP